MTETTAPTVALYIPKFGRVCDVNLADVPMFREQYQAIDAAAYLGGGNDAAFADVPPTNTPGAVDPDASLEGITTPPSATPEAPVTEVVDPAVARTKGNPFAKGPKPDVPTAT